MPLSAGTRMGPYEILAPIGAGGMGEVYRARDTKLKRDVAIKVLPEAFARDPERMARFQREAEMLASLNHPNIAAIYGVEERALVMELVEGDSPKGPLPFDETWKIASQIAAALEYAHDKGIIHRDLKPANVKVTPEGVVKLLDFGLAKAFTGQSRDSGAGTGDRENSPTLTMGATEVGVILGTAAYMSPEQARGKQVDKRADIWSFGVVLYELLTGERLFRGEDAAETLAAVIHKQPDFAKIPQEARRLLEECLQKDPKQRLRDIGDAKRLLSRDSDGAGAGAKDPAPLPSRLGRIAGIVAGVLAVALAGASWIAYRATRPVEQPLTRFSVDLGPEAVAGPRITAAISPDGRRLAFVARGAGGKELLATRLLDQANPSFLGGTENASDPFFSPDSQWVGFFADSKMKKISVQGGAPVTLCDAPGARGASWGEDGNIVVTLNSPTGGLSRVSAAGGTPQSLAKPGDRNEVTHRWPQILPGGEAVLFTSASATTNGAFDNGNIQVLSLKTGQWKMVQQGGYFGRYLATPNRAGHLVYVHQGTLLGVPFDLDRLEVRGTPTPLLEDVAGDTVTAGGQFDVSRNGTFVYLGGKSSGTWPLVWLDSTGKTQPLLASPGLYFTPRLSPDGKRLAVSVNQTAIGVYDSERDTMTPLTFKPQTSVYPVWTPDGKHIVFVAAAGAATTLQWIRSDGAGEAQPLLESKTGLRPYSFSPDGQRLAFSEDRVDTGTDFWTLPLDLNDLEHPKAGKPELLLHTMAYDDEPAFSPDGRWIAYRSFATGINEVFVQPFPGPGGKWVISAGGGRHPVWSRNGRELFYQAPDYRIMVATYTTKGDSFASDKPRIWAQTQILEPNAFFWNLDLAPDGKRFVVAPRPDATGGQKGSVHVTVLLNFFDELRRKAPAGK
ncbi:MAG TPA: protein kinase [Bryobacteraceae bacterium]|nr:protein kinase [Bryobacteraceae bacterium]